MADTRVLMGNTGRSRTLAAHLGQRAASMRGARAWSGPKCRPAQRRITLQDGTGAYRVYAYDPVGRLTTQADSNSGGTGLVTFVDGYDEVGNRVSRVKDGVVTTWTYE